MVAKIAGENKCEVIALTNHANQMAKASPEAQELMRRAYEKKNSNWCWNNGKWNSPYFCTK